MIAGLTTKKQVELCFLGGKLLAFRDRWFLLCARVRVCRVLIAPALTHNTATARTLDPTGGIEALLPNLSRPSVVAPVGAAS